MKRQNIFNFIVLVFLAAILFNTFLIQKDMKLAREYIQSFEFSIEEPTEE